MGYTHYYEVPQKFEDEDFNDIVTDFKKFLKESYTIVPEGLPYAGEEIFLAGWHGSGKPTVNDDIISFNGSTMNDMDHESFILEKNRSSSDSFHFCKTNHKPYDLFVCALLIIATYNAPNFEYSSDGDFDEPSWMAAMSECTRILGYDLT